MKQHSKPCKTCPFTRKVEPGYLGGSPLETYVGQHFLPFRVPCHEHVDYSKKDWKPGALKVNQCVGFAMCRNSAGLDDVMPEELMKTEYDDQVDGFRNIWEFWAFHKEIPYEDALKELDGELILLCLRHELQQLDLRHVGPEEGKPGYNDLVHMMLTAHHIAVKCRKKAFEEFEEHNSSQQDSHVTQ